MTIEIGLYFFGFSLKRSLVLTKNEKTPYAIIVYGVFSIPIVIETYRFNRITIDRS